MSALVRRFACLVALLCGLLGGLMSCDSTPSNINPPSLWIGIAQREIDLVLLDHEPPPF